MNILKKILSKNNNEIILVEQGDWGNGIFNDKKTILIIGVVHGDEIQGKFLIENYLKSLAVNAEKKQNRMLFLPCLNPDGYELKIRQNANGVDLNRNFATKNWGRCDDEKSQCSDYFGGENPASEIETRFVQDILAEFSPDLVLTIHAPFRVVNYDGPAKISAEKIAEIMEYPLQADIGYPTPGSFGTYAGVEKNISVITLELDEETSIEELQPKVNEVFQYLADY